MKTNVNKEKQMVGLLYGVAAGLAFAIFAWGVDAFLLARAHSAYPWVKFLPGLLISLIAGGLAGWLTVLVQKGIIGIGLWLLYGFLLSKLFIWLPLKATPYIISLFDKELGAFLDYPYYKELAQIKWFGFATVAIIGIICALIENILIDQALFSPVKFSYIIPLGVSFLCFCLAGNAIDGLYNKNIREPIQAVDKLIQFAVDNIDKEVSPETRRAMHLSALNGVREYLPRDRALILSNFDRSFGQVDILVDFSGYWVKCTTIYNQVTFCKEAIEMPKSLFSNFSEETVIKSQEIEVPVS